MFEVLKGIWAVIIIFVLLAAIVLALGYWPTSEDSALAGISPVQPFLKHLGFSLIVSVVIILTVEISFRKWHKDAADKAIADIKRNLFHAIYSRYIPDVVLEQVEKCLLKCDISRSQYEIAYELELIDDNEDETLTDYSDDYLLVNASTSYVLENLRGCDVEHNVIVELELPPDSILNRYTQIISVQIDNTIFSASEIDQYTSHEDGIHRIFKYPITIGSNQRVPVEITAQMIKRRTDVEVWASILPSDGVTLRVLAPREIEVKATANHFEELEGPVPGPKFEKRWKLHHGIFPYQSIIWWWTSRPQKNLPGIK